jgi:hypothetical protein
LLRFLFLFHHSMVILRGPLYAKNLWREVVLGVFLFGQVMQILRICTGNGTRFKALKTRRIGAQVELFWLDNAEQ